MIHHEAILASAGSGKTTQLALRHIRLMACGVDPERIVAMTFSRKAAGEIFDTIVGELVKAATSEEKARETAERIRQPRLARRDFLAMLRRLLDSLHRLRIGTLDSFIVGVIRSFPLELGIAAELEILDTDGPAALAAQREVFGRIFSPRQADRAAQRRFQEAFKQATYGLEEKGIEKQLAEFIQTYRGYSQTLPFDAEWGEEEAIWKEPSPWLKAAAEDAAPVAGRLSRSIEARQWPTKTKERWATFLGAAANFAPGSEWNHEIRFLFEKLMNVLPDLRSGAAEVTMDRRSERLSKEECGLALGILSHIMGTEIRVALERTRGIFRVLKEYDEQYDVQMRRRGRVTFADAQYLLAGADRGGRNAVLSRTADRERRLYIDYRLDCRLDHWLLDEFQDTSDLQWKAIENLSDEILQDDSGERSFFFVGDVKQAIHGWRGGNARLFGRLLEHYGSRIHTRPLNTSFRCSRPVIEMVNGVFGRWPESHLPKRVEEDWDRVWQEHQSGNDAPGHAAVIEPPCRGAGKPDAEDRYHVVANLLREIEPLKRGLSVAVLVRSNDCGGEVVNFLRQECRGIGIVHEGYSPIRDNLVVNVLAALVAFAGHPGDTLAGGLIRMSPLGRILGEASSDSGRLPLGFLQEIAEGGFQAFMRRWGRELNQVHPLDAFGRKRLDDLIAAAGEFDATGKRDCNDFLDFLDGYQIKDPSAADAVRVMTVHQSKGLGFDIVILPDLQGRGILNQDVDFVVARDPVTNHPLWGLKMPRKIIAEHDEVLAAEVSRRVEDGCFEELCVMYVALTRAKRGLYVVTSFPGRTSEGLYPATLIKRQLIGDGKARGGKAITLAGEEFDCLVEFGDRDWYKQVTLKAAGTGTGAAHDVPAGFHEKASRRRRLIRVEPSARHTMVRDAGSLFADSTQGAKGLGSALHELFERVSWIEDLDAEQLIRGWRETSSAPDELKARAEERFRKALGAAELRRALSRPSGGVELWRERRFDMVRDAEWVSGVFDRVVIVRDAEGRPLRATVQDYKSDDLGDEAAMRIAVESYRPQLNLYGRALSRILGLEAEKVRREILFLGPGRVQELRASGKGRKPHRPARHTT